MPKHTAGRWTYETGPALEGRYHTVEAEDGTMVCECYEGTEDEQEANARLCAATPELLAACEAAKEWLEGWASAEPYIQKLEAAIARATA
jgi:hypothetical protein